MQRLGFLGIGLMGEAMTRRLRRRRTAATALAADAGPALRAAGGVYPAVAEAPEGGPRLRRGAGPGVAGRASGAAPLRRLRGGGQRDGGCGLDHPQLPALVRQRSQRSGPVTRLGNST